MNAPQTPQPAPADFDPSRPIFVANEGGKLINAIVKHETVITSVRVDFERRLQKGLVKASWQK